MTGLTVEYCGEVHTLSPGDSFSIGRDADLAVDDNPFLHRRLIQLTHESGFWWISNVGSRLAVTVSGGAGSLQAWVAPGTRMPLVLARVAVLFTAAATTYELELTQDVHAAGTVFDVADPETEEAAGDATLGAVDLTPSQLLLLVALAEGVLRRTGTGAIELPTNAAAASRLGWSLTTFNRKLDNVCDKYDRAGVKGLRGGRDGLATSRRARLVEYAVAARIVRPEHLADLDTPRQQEVTP
ncbi:hypothetical protein [Nocardioides flavescens]|uniref:FHA domain-containing protein n=1 Tax=Nocardioides flavescens TaxID=2691959 RepID=A0A6L7F199_9ACTN|nr:hypothetical protein [Nocardioides flavescens]MXG90889.1 hypothetical protein [Nocardioides flavescens]